MIPLQKYLSLVKFGHTVFALPFALVGLAYGFLHGGEFHPPKLLLVLACMVTARNAAMGFNRWADRHIDAVNPRTQARELPAGRLSAQQALAFVVLNCLLFIAATFFINRLCFYLSPVALAVILGYSYTKRFTALCHLILGLGLGLEPVGAYIAVTAEFALAPILLGVAVMCWVGGFDIIYALQDDAFDARHKLHSIPAALGRRTALRVSRGLHGLSGLAAAGFALLVGGGPALLLGLGVFVLLLARQHRLVRPDDLSRVDLAFFTTNGLASVAFGSLVLADVILRAVGGYPVIWTAPAF